VPMRVQVSTPNLLDRAEGCGVLVGLYPGTRPEQLAWKAFLFVARPGPGPRPADGNPWLLELLIQIPTAYPLKEPVVEFENPVSPGPLPVSWNPAMSLFELALQIRSVLVSGANAMSPKLR
jgi:hypothetical protein